MFLVFGSIFVSIPVHFVKVLPNYLLSPLINERERERKVTLLHVLEVAKYCSKFKHPPPRYPFTELSVVRRVPRVGAQHHRHRDRQYGDA